MFNLIKNRCFKYINTFILHYLHENLKIRRFLIIKTNQQIKMEIVAEGVEFSDTSCCVMWLNNENHVGIYKNIKYLVKYHNISFKKDPKKNITYIEFIDA